MRSSDILIAMVIFKHIRKHLLFTMIVSISLVIGLLIPSFYDWSGADQSRPSPVILPIAIGLMLSSVLFCFALPWMPLGMVSTFNSQHAGRQINLRIFLIAITLFALLIVAIKSSWVNWICGGLAVLTLAYVASILFRFPSTRLAIIAMFASMYFPYLWIVTSAQHFSSVYGLFGLPLFLPSLLVSGWLRYSNDELLWLPILGTSLQLLLGVGLIRVGPKPFVAFLVVSALLSTFGSFGINALMRM